MNKNSLFDVIDGWLVKSIYKQVCPLEANKKQGNAWSATISNYKNFLDYLEVGVSSDEDKNEDVQSAKKLLKETNNIVDFWGFVLRVILKYDENLSKLEKRLNYNTVTVGFKFCRFGKKVESLKLIPQNIALVMEL